MYGVLPLSGGACQIEMNTRMDVEFSYLGNDHLVGLQTLDGADDGLMVIARCGSKGFGVLNAAISV